MIELRQGTWVLVADGEKAMFLENLTDGEDPYLRVLRHEEQENPRHGEQTSDRPGRMPDAGVGQRSSMQEADWHKLAKDRFASEMADLLYRYAHMNAFSRIVLVAPSKVLGALRDQLHKEVSQRVIAEVSKDMTNHPVNEVERLLKTELAARR
ncbi:host attachment family protein [Roseovarius salinarum]|uniref:host attachment family protein n=1 Tax=Roseovarius salinarum TaxID=1981892 RepID=UPI000C31F748|nr:host attachment family protein [Roseovarius salinarum]